MGALVPIAGGAVKVAGAMPALRVIQGGLTAAGGSAGVIAGGGAAGGGSLAAGAGAVIGPALALAGAFALGFEAGTALLGLWNWLNGGRPGEPISPAEGDLNTWPTAKPGQVVTYNWGWKSAGYGESAVIIRQYGTSVGGFPRVTFSNANAYYQGLGQNGLANYQDATHTQNGGVPGAFVLISYSTSDGLPPNQPLGPSTPGPSRSPLIDALNRARESVGLSTEVPLAFIPPASPVIPSAPSRAPVVVPAPVIAPAPATSPVSPPGRPAPATQPGQIPRITPGPGTAPAPAPVTPTFPQVDPARPVVPIGPDGLPIPTPPAPVPVTPPWLAPYPGAPVGDPAQRPRPNLEAIAVELGRQEQKQAALLSRSGVEGGLAEKLREQLENLRRDLLDNVPGGSYHLQPACPPPGGSDPLPPVVVSWDASDNATEDLRKRIDAIAALIQAHKAMGQPTCNTPISGSEVTVHFESP